MARSMQAVEGQVVLLEQVGRLRCAMCSQMSSSWKLVTAAYSPFASHKHSLQVVGKQCHSFPNPPCDPQPLPCEHPLSNPPLPPVHPP